MHEEEGLYFERGTDINTLGIEEHTRQSTQGQRFQIVPSVTDHICTATFDVSTVGEVKLTIYDVTGRRIDEAYSETVGQGRQAMDVPVSHLSNGTYFVVLETTTGRQTAKFVVVR